MSNNIAIGVSVDTADLTAKRAVLSAELRAATADLNKFANTARSGMTDELRAQMQQAGAAVAALKAQLAAVNAELKAGAAEATGFGAKLRESMRGATEGLEGLNGIREMFSGLGEALMAAFAVEGISEFAHKMAETAEETLHTAQTFGLLVGQVQQLQGVAAGAGVPFEALTTGMMRLDRAFGQARQGSKQQAQAFAELGISLKDNPGQFELLNQAMAKFGEMAGGWAKVNLEMAVFGRNVQGIGPLLAMTSEQWAELNAKAVEFGDVNTKAIASGGALAESLNTGKMAMMGIGNIMTETFAPILTTIVDGLNDFAKAFVASYQAGGLAKTVMDALATELKIIESVFIAIQAANGAALGAIVNFGKLGLDAIKLIGTVVKDLYDDLVNMLKPAITYVGNVATEVWHGIQTAWGAVVDFVKHGIDDWKQENSGLLDAIGMIAKAFEWVEGVVAGVISNIVKWAGEAADAVGRFFGNLPGVSADMAKIGADGKKTFSDITQSATDAAAAIKKVWGPGAAVALPTDHGTTADDRTKQPKAPKPKKNTGEETDTQALQEAFEAIENSHNDMLRDMQADELAYWKSVKTNVDGSALTDKQAAEIRIKIAQLTHAEAMKGIQEEIAADRENAQEAVGNARNISAARIDALQQQIKDVEEAEKDKTISHATATTRIVALIDQQEQAAALAAQMELAARLAADDLIMMRAAKTTTEYKEAFADRLKAATDFDAAMVKAHDTASGKIEARNRVEAERFKTDWDHSITPLVTDFANGLLQMAEHAKSFRQVMLGLGQTILEDEVRNLAKSLSQFIETQAAKVLVSKAASASQAAAPVVSNQPQVLQDARTAAANVYATVSAIPVVGPFLAPEAAAAAFVAVEAFSAAGGFDIPSGLNPITQLHTREMVLPQPYADVIRGMAGGGPWGDRGGETRGGDIHYSPIFHGVNASQVAHESERQFTRRIEKMRRRGVIR